jgi:glycosyltransferase involved in cell wall biosynthesis
MARLNFKDIVILDDNSMIIGFYLKELLKPDLFIYLIRDAVLFVSYHKRHGTLLEPKLVAKSDLTVTNSDYFCNYAKQFNTHSYMIGQGCDLSMYSDRDGSLAIPEDVKNIPKPVIGYVGALTTIRLDIAILVEIARSRPDWNLVLVGPEDEKFARSELHQMPNVIFLGRKEPDQLPGYIKGFDVTLNPQVLNKITDVNYPLKIDEYLAMGKPVVATRTTFMNYFKDYTYLPLTKEEYVGYIEQALRENTPDLEQRRKEFAAGHSWENFVGKIYSHATAIEKEKKSHQSVKEK